MCQVEPCYQERQIGDKNVFDKPPRKKGDALGLKENTGLIVVKRSEFYKETSKKESMTQKNSKQFEAT